MSKALFNPNLDGEGGENHRATFGINIQTKLGLSCAKLSSCLASEVVSN